MSEEIQRNELGQFTKKPDVAYTFDKENALENQKKGVLAKLDNQREANEAAMVTAIEFDQALTDLSPEQGAALIVAKQTIKAISPDQPGTTAAARFVMQETGRSQERQPTQGTTTNILHLPDNIRIAIGHLLAPVPDHADVVDLPVVEVEEAERSGEGQGNSGDGQGGAIE